MATTQKTKKINPFKMEFTTVWAALKVVALIYAKPHLFDLSVEAEYEAYPWMRDMDARAAE